MCSLESGLILIGLPLSRHGPVECDGHSVWLVGRKIRRLARPSLACEAASLEMVADSAVWYRDLFAALRFGVFDSAPFPSTRQTPRTTPFPPPDSSVPSAKRVFSSWANHSTHPSVGFDHDLPVSIQPSCLLCSSESPMLLDQLVRGYDHFTTGAVDGCRIYIPRLTDWSNAYQARQQLQFKGEWRMAKIHLSFLRDLAGALNLSYVTDGFNIPDACTKLAHNSALLYRLASARRLAIALLSRQVFGCLQSFSDARRVGSYFA